MAAVLSLGVATGCEEELPTTIGPEVPGEPVTVEVTIPWSDFASDLEVFGGYGSAGDLGQGFVANQYQGTLDARTLLRFQEYPTSVTVRDSTGTQRPDTDLTFIGGRFVAFFDTVASTAEAPVSLELGATQTEWDPQTASWSFALDTIGDQRPWPESGGGPVTGLGTATWDPAFGDSVVFPLDSAAIAAWSDPNDDAAGARVNLIDVGERLQMNGAVLRLDVRPSINPDTIVETTAFTAAVTFIYTPLPPAEAGGIRIGGSPSWRTILDLAIPEVIDGPASFCAVVSCPHTVDPVQISYAALVLTSRTSEPAYQPGDSVRLDVRPVYNRPAMPKAPLGNSLIDAANGRSVAGSAFGSSPGQRVEIPFTTFARDLLRGVDEDGNATPGTLALLSVIEPFSIGYASFVGPGSVGEPELRLVLTIGPPLELP
jgi:hypothetical protein